MTISKEKRDDIRKRADEASPGPWQRSRFVDKPQYRRWSAEEKQRAQEHEGRTIRGPGRVGDPSCNVVMRIDRSNSADIEFIANAREDIPYLLDALEEAEAKYNQLLANFPACPCKLLQSVEAERDAAIEAIKRDRMQIM